jgi:hypothetical protein
LGVPKYYPLPSFLLQEKVVEAVKDMK